ncbi:hypothetical protein [Budvicia aquatica]|uniref:Uncharacterized protein n=1 Tax=Budvicia aquatica TaxID=82979 RepID=A0A2C6C2M1_9GAMM|nr:hypothetical protein [Budvicia aquatica]PHI30600.1 hypothetical protein CRN84_15265 [Budvicia aquatica]VFS50032.1 Uncharacterised protein [Budvicia aquatica]
MSNEVKFTASVVNYYTEDDVLVMGIGDDPTEPENYLIISRFDDGEIDDSIGIQTHLSEMETSNAIEKVILNRTNFIVDIKAGKEEKVNASRIVVTFSNDNIDYVRLKNHLSDIFFGSSVSIN